MNPNISNFSLRQISIRSEMKNDHAAIQRVNDLAFGRTGEGMLIDILRHSDKFEPRLSLVSELDEEIIGHALFFPISILAKDGEEYPCLSLGPIAVIPEYQKRGIGGMLIEAGHRAALNLDFTAVVLLGHPTYYPRFGYRPAENWNLTNPWQISGESWMATELVEGALRGKAGLTIYPDAFNHVT